MTKTNFYYIASPYSAANVARRMLNFTRTEGFLAWALKRELVVFSTIVHTHSIAGHYELPKDAKFWQNYNEAMLRAAGGMIVLCIPGWDGSVGVDMEIKFCEREHIPIWYAKLPNDAVNGEGYYFVNESGAEVELS